MKKIILISFLSFFISSISYSQFLGKSVFKNNEEVDIDKFFKLDISKYKITDVKILLGDEYSVRKSINKNNNKEREVGPARGLFAASGRVFERLFFCFLSLFPTSFASSLFSLSSFLSSPSPPLPLLFLSSFSFSLSLLLSLSPLSLSPPPALPL